MSTPTPTLINLPPPPSETPTPSERGPGTPNSGTTSLSALSTTAIKDGHQGNLRPHGHRLHRSSSNSSDASTTTLDAERADRISRLAGLERVSASRTPVGGTTGAPFDTQSTSHPPGYFDTSASLLQKERSTVGSASATGSVGGRTTWASGSDIFDQDKIGDDDGSSTGGFSEEGNASLVGFGEGANSTVSGPVSAGMNRMTVASRQSSGFGAGNSPTTNRLSGLSAPASQQSAPYATGVVPPSSPSAAGSHTRGPEADDVRMVDGVTFDEDIIDTTVRSPPPVNG